MSAWVPGCWHRLYPPEVVERFYRDKARREARPPVTMDRFGCPALREPAPEEVPRQGGDPLAEVVAGVVERLLPDLVRRIREQILATVGSEIAAAVAQAVARRNGTNGVVHGRRA